MDRVLTLCNKLQEQLAQKASVDQLLVTVEMLQSELLHSREINPIKAAPSAVAVKVAMSAYAQPAPASSTTEREPEKTVETLQVDEAELEAELEEIKKHAQEKNNMGTHNKPALLFDPVEDIPTLVHQQGPPANVEEEKEKEKEVAPTAVDVAAPAPKSSPTFLEKATEVHQALAKDQSSSLNDRLKQSQIELGDSLVETPIKDLKKAVGVNDRFLFINELFRGDEVMYERSIKTINSFSIYPEAEYWIKRELKLKLGWNDRNEVVKQFDQLIKRRFL